jgi:hypothetical protein
LRGFIAGRCFRFVAAKAVFQNGRPTPSCPA